MAETRGRDDCHGVPGKSGERGCLQYLTATYNLHSQIILGYIAPRTQVNEEYIATKMVQRWLDRGYTAKEIALIWNGGQPVIKRGVNAHGQEYDTGAYATTVLAYLNQ